ncbi:MAG: ABC transporter substrate-binding protein [Chloroflexi bacterium]|nr:ABC transporter substrate-binding protein [Chloroflexota bacterium]
MKTTRKGMIVVATLIVASLMASLLASCSSGSSQTTASPTPATKTDKAQPSAANSGASKDLTEVTVGGLGIGTDVPFWIAQDKGYFAEQGINMKFEPFRAGEEMIPLLATNKLAVGWVGTNPGMFNAYAQGVPINIVGSMAKMSPTQDSSGFIVRADLADQIKTAKDLKGRTIATNSMNAAGRMYLETYLQKGGLTFNDVTVKELSFPDVATAMGNKLVDFAFIIEPYIAIAASKKLATKVTGVYDVYGPHDSGVLLGSPEFVQNKKLSQGFMVAFMKAGRDYYNAFIKGQEPLRTEMVQIAVKNTALKDPALYKVMSFSGPDPNGQVDLPALSKIQDYWVKVGSIKNPVEVNKMIDTSLVDNALKVLGEYKDK